MGILKEVIAGAIGYGIASATDSKVVGDIIDNNITSKSLEEIIDNYARRRMGVYTSSNELAHRLHKIAKRYEEYNYDRVYGDEY